MGLMLGVLAARGEVAVVGRRGKQRVWDLAERWYPETEKIAWREAKAAFEEQALPLARRAASSAGKLVAHPDAEDGPVPAARTTFLSPFDRLIHDRKRAEALWGFYYRLEMYVPKAKREYGYYVLPILRGDRVVGRIEPVHDRKAGTLRVLGTWWERQARPRAEAAAEPRAFLGASLDSAMDFETRAIHAGQEPDPATGAIITPIYQTSTFVQEAVGVHKGYDYARVANPTRTALQVALASLENAKHGIAFSSGLGATTTLMHLVDPGQRVVLIADVYGGVYRMTSQVYEPKGYEFTYVPAAEFDDNLAAPPRRGREARLGRDAVEPAAERRRHPQGGRRRARRRRAARRRQHLRDAVPAAAARARRRRGRALDDEVPRRAQRHRRRLHRHATTTRSRERLFFLQKSLGAVPGPFDAWLVLRGIKTLAVRMRAALRERAPRRASSSTATPRVERVLWPGLPIAPGHEVARRRCATSAAWSRSSLETEEEAVELVARTKLFQLAESLGGVESLIEHPARMTHASTAGAPFAPPGEPRAAVGRDRVGRRPARRPRSRARQTTATARV